LLGLDDNDLLSATACSNCSINSMGMFERKYANLYKCVK
jgi:hypothetical protein